MGSIGTPGSGIYTPLRKSLHKQMLIDLLCQSPAPAIRRQNQGRYINVRQLRIGVMLRNVVFPERHKTQKPVIFSANQNRLLHNLLKICQNSAIAAAGKISLCGGIALGQRRYKLIVALLAQLQKYLIILLFALVIQQNHFHKCHP